LLGGAPRSIITGAVLPPGLSGGITAAGTLAAIAAAAAFAAFGWSLGIDRHLAFAAAVGAVVGVLADSVLGATLQVRRWCTACNEFTERELHVCGAATIARGGLAWFDNDGVNAASSLASGGVAAAVAALVV